MFPLRLKTLRKNKGYTLEDLSQLYNKKYNGKISKGTLSKYENGNQEPMITVVKNLAALFGVSADYMLGLTEDENISNNKSSDNMSFDDFTYAMYNETKELSEEDKKALLDMAKIFKNHLNNKEK